MKLLSKLFPDKDKPLEPPLGHSWHLEHAPDGPHLILSLRQGTNYGSKDIASIFVAYGHDIRSASGAILGKVKTNNILQNKINKVNEKGGV